MILRVLLTIIACSVTLAAATETPQARAARYYAAGLELPLLQLRHGAQLLRTCATRLRAACSKQQRELAAKNRTLALLNELSLFPRPTDADSADLKRAADLRQRIQDTSDALLQDANVYDRLLLVRYGAALETCPGDYDLATYNQTLEKLTSAELREFQGVAEPDVANVITAMNQARREEAERLRSLPPEDCAAVVDVGQLLMELMTSKLEPWTHADRRIADQDRRLQFDATPKPPRDDTLPPGLANSVAGNFITVVATELQLKVFPETAPRIKAIAEAEGFHAD